MKTVRISFKNYRHIKRLTKNQGITMRDITDLAIELYLSKLENQVSMQAEKKGGELK